MTSYPDAPTDDQAALENAQQMVDDFNATMQAYKAFLDQYQLPAEYWQGGMQDTLTEHVGNLLNETDISDRNKQDILLSILPERAIPIPVKIP